jgi:phospholipid/cholesterol/gamma-HCH transport system substrate-binding protein
MDGKNQNLAVGGFVLFALAILLFGIYFLKGMVPGQRQDTYHVLFDQVSTLQNGDPVKINGVKAGKVERIALDGNKVKVTLTVDRAVKLGKDCQVRIQNIGLMGERQIGIQLGSTDEVWPAGSTLQGSLDAGIAEAMGVAGEVFVQAESLVRNLRAVLDSTVARPDFAPRFNSILDETETLVTRMSGFLGDIDPRLKRSLGSIEKAGQEVTALVAEQREPLTAIVANGRDASERLKGLGERAEHVATEMEALLKQVNSDQGTVGALLRDTTMHRQLSHTLNSADSLFRIIRKRGLDVNLNLF